MTVYCGKTQGEKVPDLRRASEKLYTVMSSSYILKLTSAAFCGLLLLQCVSSTPTEEPASKPDQAPMRGIYLDVNRGRNLDLVRKLVERGKPLGINYIVIDVQPFGSYRFLSNPEVIAYLKSQDIYVTGRVVCFQDGMSRKPSEERLNQLYALMEKTGEAGFNELQLDYIRFVDDWSPYSLQQKYDFIDSILQRAEAVTDAHNMNLGADLFGRVVYNHDDIIGQKIENFAKRVDVIYPMLYPSHFIGDTKRLSNPGFTIEEGTTKGLNRLKGTKTRLQPFIQAFGYNVGYARMSYKDYIIAQIKAAEKTEARGWVAWNARAEYETLFQALEELAKEETASTP